MKTVTFSKRLYGLPGMLIFLGLTVGFGQSVLQHVQTQGTPQGTTLMLIGLILFIVVGTLGWRYCLQRRSLLWMRGYFVFQVLLFFGLFWLENADTRTGAGVGNLVVILLLQVNVLGWWSRWMLHVITVLIMLIVSAFYLSTSRIIAPSVIVFLTNGAVLLLGNLIVSEEKARDQLSETNRKLTEYAAQAEELATTKERNRMAREIHDNLGHYLTAINMQLEAAQAILPTEPARAQQAMSKAQGLTKEGLSEIRRSVAALRAEPVESRPLDEAITLLVEEFRANGLNINYHVEGSIRPAPASVEMALYRIAQEGLTNIRKHAQATRAELELRYDDNGHVRLKMLNDGATHASNNSGFGLIGIQERVKLLGGTLNIQHAEGQDFSLLVELPA